MAEERSATAISDIKELPPEIWKTVLRNLDELELMKCRLVNKCWKDLSSQVLSESTSFWKATFGTVGRRKPISDLVSGGRATRFSTPDQITCFMEEMKGSTNPFPNGTVIFTRDSKPSTADHLELVAFQENFCKLLDVFNDAILNLGYSLSGYFLEEADFSEQFCSILSLRNLRSLVVEKSSSWNSFPFFKPGGGRKMFEEMLESKQVTMPERLRELYIHGTCGFIPLFYMFGGTESILKSVSSLEISNGANFGFRGTILPNTPERLALLLCQFPNLKKLKVRFPDAKFLQQFQQFRPQAVASLKEVSLHFCEFMTSIEHALEETFVLLDLHAETLELLHLDLDSYSQSYHKDFAMGAHGMFTSVTYTKLRTLLLCLSDIYNWPNVITELMAKFVNLQEFKIILPRDMKIRPRDQYKKVAACWNLLPATVRVITVPDYGWKINRGESLQFDDETGELK